MSRPPECVTAYIAVGSNIDPETNIPRALELLAQHARITGVSTFYVTAALGRPEQPDYRNGVARVETDVSARALKYDVLRGIEHALGRVRTHDKYAAREIDLDVLLYGALVTREADLKIPDPELGARIFLAAPLFELAPALILPDTGVALAEFAILNQPYELNPADALTAALKERLLP